MNPDYRSQYIDLWKTCQINSSVKNEVSNLTDKILSYKKRYTVVALALDIPWYLIACIHSLEADLSFNTHLHNGDPLSARTVHVPSGRPKTGNPPFTWEFSASDALLDKINGIWADDLADIRKENITSILYALESYNGLGYKKYHPEVKTPYLWSKTNKYTSGKYTEDGKFDLNAVSDQIGAAAILKSLEEKGEITNIDIQPFNTETPIISLNSSKKTILMLQIFLNQLDGTKVDEDGKVGPITKNRFKEVFGFELV